MPPQTRRMAFPKVVIERDTDSEQSSSEEEEEEEEELEEPEVLVESENEEKVEEAKKKGKAPITISLKKVCKVKPLSISFSIFKCFIIGFLSFSVNRIEFCKVKSIFGVNKWFQWSSFDFYW